jgi:hypothetical protein
VIGFSAFESGRECLYPGEIVVRVAGGFLGVAGVSLLHISGLFLDETVEKKAKAEFLQGDDAGEMNDEHGLWERAAAVRRGLGRFGQRTPCEGSF